ncbi:ferrochelatase [Reichenbachiella agarivorans]|uniref:Ferrochelatase n=1 Tax=Reichenbachiella agarivorans TaxID=2979464 RepID=A0ABY6CSB2_9BACT|nr:ferrochelatase [Reichenbachiella agarivorans]UXP33229.1 ferrochelatase [Reichenbachiella agarivorans]
MKKGVLLVNLGTPDSPSVPHVRKYLREFLMDGRVIDIPYISRWLLINLIIVPFRGPKSAKEYQKLWEDRGSPLKFYGEDLAEATQKKLGKEYEVVLAMRYQSPSIQKGLEQLKAAKVNSIKVIPLFPQYASASTGSVIQEVMRIVSQWQVIPKLEIVDQFIDQDLFIETIALNAKKLMKDTEYDHFLFSYHGLPERQIYKAEIGKCAVGNCCNHYGEANKYCYRAQCFETTRLVSKKLGLDDSMVTTSFQSRLGKNPWIQPYTDHKLVELAEGGIKKVLAFSPAFISDCLETTFEVGKTYKKDFIDAGGEQWDLVPSLNVEETWVDCVVEMSKH